MENPLVEDAPAVEEIHVEDRDKDEMYKTFNMGVGMVVVMGREDAEAVMASGDCSSFGVSIIGEVVRDDAKGVQYARR